MAAITNGEKGPHFPDLSFQAGHWLDERLSALGKTKIADLSPEEKAQIADEARGEAKSTRAKSISTAILVSLAIAAALPALIVLGFLISSGVLVIAPDSLLYPLLAGGLCAGGYGGFKLTQAIVHFFKKTVCAPLDHAQNLDRLAARIY